jgi:hypothetical protein
MSSDGDWSEWRNHVLKELVRQNDNIEALNDKLDTFEKTCLQKEGDQKVDNAETRLKIYYVDFIIGGGASALFWVMQWYLTTH